MRYGGPRLDRREEGRGDGCSPGLINGKFGDPWIDRYAVNGCQVVELGLCRTYIIQIDIDTTKMSQDEVSDSICPLNGLSVIVKGV